MTLQQTFEEERAKLRTLLENVDADDVLQRASDASYTTDNHKWKEADAVREAFDALRKYNVNAELYEARLQASHYTHADDVYFVAGKDEDDAVRRFQAALVAVYADLKN